MTDNIRTKKQTFGLQSIPVCAPWPGIFDESNMQEIVLNVSKFGGSTRGTFKRSPNSIGFSSGIQLNNLVKIYIAVNISCNYNFFW